MERTYAFLEHGAVAARERDSHSRGAWLAQDQGELGSLGRRELEAVDLAQVPTDRDVASG
jgi:hypothetical protein